MFKERTRTGNRKKFNCITKEKFQCIKNSLNFIFKRTTICVGKENDTKQVTINYGLMNLLKNNNLNIYIKYYISYRKIRKKQDTCIHALFQGKIILG